MSALGLTVPELLRKKKDGHELDDGEIDFFVECICNNHIDRSQVGAMLMAFCLRGLSTPETVALTKAMMYSGEVQQWEPSWKVVDKHSTGGVGDKVTFPLVAAAATFGLKMPMITGRGLGHTGGTADKLESIPGFSIHLTREDLARTLRDVGCYITTTEVGNIAPADKVLYATRDITSTVCYAPLVCSSIMSKKLAEGIGTLLLDVKTGGASLAGSMEQAEWLATTMVKIGTDMGVDTTAVITEMDTPIGYTIGNSLEMIESLECIKGRGPRDLEELVCIQGGILLHSTGLAISHQHGQQLIRDTFQDGSALEKFCEILGNQGVKQDTVGLLKRGRYEEVFRQAECVERIVAQESGYVESVDALVLGRACVVLGGGRQLPGDAIDDSVGIKMRVSKGEEVKEGDLLAEVHHNGRLTPHIKQRIEAAFVVGNRCQPVERVVALVRSNSEVLQYKG